MGLSLTLNTAAQTLMNTQLEIQTASNNISNSSSTGYAEETAVQTENPTIQTTYGWLGTGATVSNITQARDSFLEQQLMSATTSDSQYTSLSSELTAIQSACSDSGTNGISSALGNFFDAWSTLSQDPTGLSGQTAVSTAAQNLASAVQSTYDQLNQIAGQIPGQITDAVNQANTLIDQIAQLNTAIVQSSTPTSQANNLIDQRYQAMDSLSKLIPVSFSQDQTTGMVNVTTTNANGTLTVVSGGTQTHITTPPAYTGGQLGALETAQTDLTGFMSQLSDFAATLISQVNSISSTNNGSAVFSGTDASNITSCVSFPSTQTSAQLSAETLAMGNLQDSQVTFTDQTNSTLQQYLSNIQQTVGNDVQSANNNQTFYDAFKSQLQTQQQAVSGVSQDQEMVNVIQDQQIYEEAAKVVQTVSTLWSTIINMVQ